jgi:hypothetical protein
MEKLLSTKHQIKNNDTTNMKSQRTTIFSLAVKGYENIVCHAWQKHLTQPYSG